MIDLRLERLKTVADDVHEIIAVQQTIHASYSLQVNKHLNLTRARFWICTAYFKDEGMLDSGGRDGVPFIFTKYSSVGERGIKRGYNIIIESWKSYSKKINRKLKEKSLTAIVCLWRNQFDYKNDWNELDKIFLWIFF